MPSAYYVCYLKLCGCVSFDNMYVKHRRNIHTIPFHAIPFHTIPYHVWGYHQWIVPFTALGSAAGGGSPLIWKSHKIPWFQTTNQPLVYPMIFYPKNWDHLGMVMTLCNSIPSNPVELWCRNRCGLFRSTINRTSQNPMSSRFANGWFRGSS